MRHFLLHLQHQKTLFITLRTGVFSIFFASPYLGCKHSRLAIFPLNNSSLINPTLTTTLHDCTIWLSVICCSGSLHSPWKPSSPWGSLRNQPKSLSNFANIWPGKGPWEQHYQYSRLSRYPSQSGTVRHDNNSPQYGAIFPLWLRQVPKFHFCFTSGLHVLTRCPLNLS